MESLYIKLIDWFIEYKMNHDKQYQWSNAEENVSYTDNTSSDSKYGFCIRSKYLNTVWMDSKKKKHDHEVYKDHNNAFYTLSYNAHGASGGNCWGDDARSYYNDTPKNFTMEPVLAACLTQFCPNIPYLKFIQLKNECTIETEHEDREYYGNYSIVKYLLIDIRKLATYLEEESYCDC